MDRLWSEHCSNFEANLGGMGGSNNLIKFTKESVADHKITIRKIERIATEFDEQAGKIFAKEFPNCNLLNIEVVILQMCGQEATEPRCCTDLGASWYQAQL